MNFLVSHITRRPPIKVTQRKLYKETTVAGIRYVSHTFVMTATQVNVLVDDLNDVVDLQFPVHG